MKGEIAVTRRAAYAAEEAMQKLEKEKQQQDYLIDDLQVKPRVDISSQSAPHPKRSCAAAEYRGSSPYLCP